MVKKIANYQLALTPLAFKLPALLFITHNSPPYYRRIFDLKLIWTVIPNCQECRLLYLALFFSKDFEKLLLPQRKHLPERK